jgi:hypothetical protein
MLRRRKTMIDLSTTQTIALRELELIDVGAKALADICNEDEATRREIVQIVLTAVRPVLAFQLEALPETNATKARDYGRGYSRAVKDCIEVTLGQVWEDKHE